MVLKRPLPPEFVAGLWFSSPQALVGGLPPALDLLDDGSDRKEEDDDDMRAAPLDDDDMRAARVDEYPAPLSVKVLRCSVLAASLEEATGTLRTSAYLRSYSVVQNAFGIRALRSCGITSRL
jgi:hypothetical protein